MTTTVITIATETVVRKIGRECQAVDNLSILLEVIVLLLLSISNVNSSSNNNSY